MPVTFPHQHHHLVLKAVLFDFDGTLTKPGALDFDLIKAQLACPPEQPVLEYIQAMGDALDRHEAMDQLNAFEIAAAGNSDPAVGVRRVLTFLKTHNIPAGILSRNSRASVMRALENFVQVSADDFTLIITRENDFAPKPDPAGIVWAAEQLGLDPSKIWIVGDFLFDIQAGQRAGAATVLISPAGRHWSDHAKPHFQVEHLYDLPALFEHYIPMPTGKLPQHLLGDYLYHIAADDPALLVRPGIGEDTAALDMTGQELIILKSDPITFATDALSDYAVLVNANDIVTAGAVPRWFMATVLFPVGITPASALHNLRELERVCHQWQITLCGGHTEVTDAVRRTIVSGTMLGTVARSDLIDKRNIRPGDCVLITKRVAVEGTALIAREFEPQLIDKGLDPVLVASSSDLLNQIGVLTEAGIAADHEGVNAMHDVTEGGVATALWELSVAGRHRIVIDLEKIPYYPETFEICTALGLDPLGLIGSGSLLICCQPCTCRSLMEKIAAAEVEVTQIGEVAAPGEGVTGRKNGADAPWPHFETDEITRLFQ
jgi:HAD superfamily hydrolase (TIGR01509 family)